MPILPTFVPVSRGRRSRLSGSRNRSWRCTVKEVSGRCFDRLGNLVTMKRNFQPAPSMPIGLMYVVKKPAPRTKNLVFCSVSCLYCRGSVILTVRSKYLLISQRKGRSQPYMLDARSVSKQIEWGSSLLYASALFPILYH